MSEPKLIKLIVIDSTAKLVYERRVLAQNSLQEMQELVGGLITLPCTYENGDGLFVNDEGLYMFKDGFQFSDFPQPFLAGNGVIAGSNADGETVSAKMTLEEAKSKVKFVYSENPEEHVRCEVRGFSDPNEFMEALFGTSH